MSLIASFYYQGQPTGYTSPIIYSVAAGAIVESAPAGASVMPWPVDATRTATVAALDAILEAYGYPATGLAALTKQQLMAYANSKVASLLALERVYALGGGVSVKCDGSVTTATNLAGLNAWAGANPSGSTQWVDDEGDVTSITAAQAQALAVAVSSYGQSVYNELGTAGLAINGGTVTTTAQIDALSWPT